MIADDRSRKKELFDELLDLPAASQRLRLEAVAEGDAVLSEQLVRLLAASRAEHLDDDFAAAVAALLDSAPLAEGTLVGSYRLGDEIARGGMGAVYRAVHGETQREVAIKVLNRAWATPLDRVRLVREYRMVAALDDEPRIARLYDVGTLDDGTPWFAMELVRGGLPITQYCVARNLTLIARLQLFREVCAAVMHAHSRAIIHRDLKPSNILVSEKGDVKLLDFGIAGILTDLNQDEDQSHVHARSLTPAFAAPERLTNQPLGAFTDLYVLGLVLYELLTRTRPFDLERRTVSEVLDTILNQPPRPPSLARDGAARLSERADWGDLDAICLKLLAINPRERYATAEGLLADVDRHLKGEPVLARPASRLYPLRKLITRRRHAVVAAAVAALAVVALTAWYSVRLASEQREMRVQMARTQRLQQFLVGLFSGAEPEVGPEKELTVRRVLERGVLTADVLTHDREIQAELTHTLGTLYRELGDFGRADELLGKSLDEKSRFLPRDDPRRIEGNIALALLRTEQMKLDEAETLARSAIDTMKPSFAETHPLMIRGGLVLGKTLTAKGRYADAIAQLEGVARHVDRSGAETADEAAVLTELANAHQYAGHLDEADRLNRRVLEIDRRVHGDRHPTVADDLINLADAESTRGRYGEAETMLREAVSILRGWYGFDHPETGSAVRILAAALTMQGRLDEAGTLLEESRAIFARVYLGPHRRIGLVLNDLGTLAFRQSRYDDAIEAFSEALAVYRQVYPDGKSQYISVGLANLGSVYVEKAEYDVAERTLREAVALSREVLSEDHTNTAIAEVKLGHTLTKQGRYEEAVPLLEQGRATMLKQRVDPSTRWLKRSSEDLATALDHTGRGREAELLRAEGGR